MNGFNDQSIQITQYNEQESQAMMRYSDQHEMNYENQVLLSDKIESDFKEIQYSVRYS